MRIYFEVKTQFSNLGDALINSCLIKMLSQKGELCICIDGVPKKFINKLDIPSSAIIFNNKKLFYIDMYVNKQKKIMFMNPGDESGELSLSQFIKKCLGLLKYVAIKFSGTDLVRIGVSYNNLGKLRTRYLKLLSKIIRLHYVRDTISLNELKDKGVYINGLIPDLAFLLEFQPKNNIPTKYALVSIRKYENVSFSDVNEYLKNIIQKDTWDWSFQVEADENYIKNLISINSDKIEVKDLTFSISNARNFYSEYEYVITNRLHVLLLAVSVGCKTIALLQKEKNKKIEGILNDLGLDNLVCFIEDVDKKILPQYDEYSEALKSSYIKMNNVVTDGINKISKELTE